MLLETQPSFLSRVCKHKLLHAAVPVGGGGGDPGGGDGGGGDPGGGGGLGGTWVSELVCGPRDTMERTPQSVQSVP
tara:strand:- start:21 stop:248 length:228 start_codon:yes stop_codon:yes gene_type:complete